MADNWAPADSPGESVRFMPATSAVRQVWLDAYPEEFRGQGGVAFDDWLSAVHERASHDMPAELFNDLAEFLQRSFSRDREAIFLLERLRSRYGASTRRALSLDGPPEPTRVRDVKEYRAPGFWETEHSENL